MKEAPNSTWGGSGKKTGEQLPTGSEKAKALLALSVKARETATEAKSKRNLGGPVGGFIQPPSLEGLS